MAKKGNGKYHEWIEEDGLKRISSWASDGLTNAQISKNIGVNNSTFIDWMKRFPEVSKALKKGREPVVYEIENALIKKARGFSYTELEESWTEDKNGKVTSEKRTKVHHRYSPPDSSAAMFLLKNYKPEKYRKYNSLTEAQIKADLEKVRAETEKMKLEAEEIRKGEELVSDDGFINAIKGEVTEVWKDV